MLSSAMIAEQVDSHATFMLRVMQSLTSAGIVESKGGREGGYILGEIYTAVNRGPIEQEMSVDCGEAAEQLDLEIERILFEAERQALDYLKKFTIEDVMNRIDFF